MSRKQKQHPDKPTNPRQCPDSEKQYNDITFSERFSGTFFCGECCSALRLPEDKPSVKVPKHDLPPELVARRRRLNEE